MSHEEHQRTRAGFATGIAAYLCWGVFPLYFNVLINRGVDANHLLAYRIAWSAVFVAILLTALRQWNSVMACLRSRRVVIALLASTVLIAINWWVYIYSVASKQVSYSALGYYMNPLVNVLLGVVILGERLRPLQIAAVILAAAGVVFQTVAMGKLPWISLTLAVSFALYGLVRKTAGAGALAGLMIETALITPIMLGFIAFHLSRGTAPQLSPQSHLFVALSGIVTATPLLLFAAAARRLKLSTLGFLQYLSPTIQFLLAVLLLDESFTWDRQITFAFIWAAVILFIIDQFRAMRRAQPVVEAVEIDM